ncbi:Cas9 inhibitor AcrIIA9 family protein [Flavobacterium sp. JAS]|uniref:Cas9 inhibitor AcrIIA9 family protein n=1 Tax=Flavobacterium sp. JAS TaxID=2897329 RepID=UPI001E2D7393|nr:Cas9 inhibitor AcrIIA9 family protein [Flavobacterium sp. JAS]MCD0472320.1 PcfK-like family protein [Flavobacterium sp. JAS]
MKASEQFKTIIENYLSQKAVTDPAFAQCLAKDSKNIQNCMDYIGGEVKKTGLCAFAEQEIFDMAVKYYTDDTISAPAQIHFKAVVNQPVKADLFTPVAEPSNAQTPVAVPTPKAVPSTLTLFDL